MTKYITASVYRDNGPDCSANGITARHDIVGVPVKNGYITREDLIERGVPILELAPPQFRGARQRFVEEGETRWVMFGGNFVFSSDSRFARAYGGPVAVHDRCEE